jgi:hypothetical protein
MGSNNVELDSDGLPIVDCDQPAPWSTPPQKTFKQVRIISLLVVGWLEISLEFLATSETHCGCWLVAYSKKRGKWLVLFFFVWFFIVNVSPP